MNQKRTMPKNHPVAWGSPLWPHLDLIRSMRLQRKKWAEIAEHLKDDHGVDVTFRTVRNFFKRATDPNRKRPLGFPQSSAQPVTAITTDAKPAPEVHAKNETKQSTGHTYEQWEAEERKKAKNQPFKTYNPNSNPSE
jgi:hypothetical protein